jgi:hypothetical protein
MSIELVFGLLIAAQAGLLSFYIHHILSCNRRDRVRAAENQAINVQLATIAGALERVQTDIGDHNSGLRGQVHRLASDISPYVVREQGRRGE